MTPTTTRSPESTTTQASWTPSVKRWFSTGTLAGLLSMAALAWHGRYRHGSSVSLINSPSHWVHGDRALQANDFSLRYTVLGAFIHQASSMFWALLFERILLKQACAKNDAQSDAQSEAVSASPPEPSAAGMACRTACTASALTALAWLVDTRVVPRRVRPGFERRASGKGMALIYGSFAIGLTLGALAVQKRSAPPDPRATQPSSPSTS